jgi:hypothetical protein
MFIICVYIHCEYNVQVIFDNHNIAKICLDIVRLLIIAASVSTD